MATASVEERLTAIEEELAQLKQQFAANITDTSLPWWEQRFGAFADSPEYEAAIRAGREYRESLRSEEDEKAA